MILKDKVIIITGGSGLIGRECVKDARKKVLLLSMQILQ